MGNKGQRRREKNYLAAHGGYTRLPPAPKSSDLDAIPSKLRTLMGFMSSSKTSAKKQDNAKVMKNATIGKNKEADVEKGNKVGSAAFRLKEQDGLKNGRTLDKEQIDEVGITDKDDKKKRKRKRKAPTDLRFQSLEGQAATGLSKRERRKKFLEERKKKHKKAKTEDKVEFPMHEEIKFGEVVEAPPKLVAFPKGTKAPLDASHERLRLQAVEDYRKRKGWESRPGVRLPSISTTPSS